MCCPDLERWSDLAEPAHRSELEAHIDLCGRCREVVAALARAGLLGEPDGDRKAVVDSTAETAAALLAGNGVDEGDEAFCSACSQSFPSYFRTCPNDGARLVRFRAQADPMIGRVLDGRYEVRAPLGRGGMGAVYSALQLSVDREVALKVVRAKLASDRMAAKRFLREARLASRLSQPNIVNVYDFGQTDDGVLFLVMELLRGRTLAAELNVTPRLGIRRASAIAMQLCDALEVAHAMGIIHRDLKPGNIMLDGPPERTVVKVLDFGLAKSLVSDAISQFTATDAILGTPLYMCPEAAQGKPSDQRGDIYALGCILHEMLSGEPPFLDPSINVVMAKHISEPPPPLPPFVLAPFVDLVFGMMAKRPEDRPQTAMEVRATLQSILEGEVPSQRSAAPTAARLADVAETAPFVPATPRGGLAATDAHVGASSTMITSRSRRDQPRRGVLRVLAAVAALAGAAATFQLVRNAGSRGAVARDVAHAPAARDGALAAALPSAAAAVPSAAAAVPSAAAAVDAGVELAAPDAAAIPTVTPHRARPSSSHASSRVRLDAGEIEFYPTGVE